MYDDHHGALGTNGTEPNAISGEARLIWAILETYIKDCHHFSARIKRERFLFGRATPESLAQYESVIRLAASPWTLELCQWVGYHNDTLLRQMRKIEASYGIPLQDSPGHPEYIPLGQRN